MFANGTFLVTGKRRKEVGMNVCPFVVECCKKEWNLEEKLMYIEWGDTVYMNIYLT